MCDCTFCCTGVSVVPVVDVVGVVCFGDEPCDEFPCDAAAQHPNVLKDPPPEALIKALGGGATQYELAVWHEARGPLRLRGAVMQIVVNAVAHDLAVEEALDRPRVHLEGDDLHCEGGHDPAELDRLEEMGWKVTRWRRRNLYFGGVSAVELLADGSLAAAGDPRRGGHGVVVE